MKLPMRHDFSCLSIVALDKNGMSQKRNAAWSWPGIFPERRSEILIRHRHNVALLHILYVYKRPKIAILFSAHRTERQELCCELVWDVIQQEIVISIVKSLYHYHLCWITIYYACIEDRSQGNLAHAYVNRKMTREYSTSWRNYVSSVDAYVIMHPSFRISSQYCPMIKIMTYHTLQATFWPICA